MGERWGEEGGVRRRWGEEGGVRRARNHAAVYRPQKGNQEQQNLSTPQKAATKKENQQVQPL